MKPALLELLQCPACGGAYTLTEETRDRDEVMSGALRCACSTHPIVRGVPRFVGGSSDRANIVTAERFGEEWNQFSELGEHYQDQFLSWIEPVRPEHFAGKTVLDGGCGKGRHVYYAKKFGAKTVVGVDLSAAVEAAFKNVGRMEDVHIIQADLFHLPLKPVFDYAYSIGVLHHTPDPAMAFTRMIEKVRPGGTVSAWVYGREGNDWIVHVLNPIRRVTSALPLPITKAIAFVCAVIMQVALKLLYAPARTRPGLKRILPYSAYLCAISGYDFTENFSIVFDHLLPGIAYYISHDEFARWFAENHLADAVITRRYNNSWRGFARKT